MSSVFESKLFQPIQLGGVKLEHRVVLAPLTRVRANAAHVIGDLALEYCAPFPSFTILVTEPNLQTFNAPVFPERF